MGEGFGISTDIVGNSFITGYTTVPLNNSQAGIQDYYLGEYSTGGVLQWLHQVGASGGYTEGFGISTNSSEHSYIVGSTTVGISGQSQVGNTDVFVAKY